MINHLSCPNCHHSNLIAKHEATYVYSYTLDKDNINDNEFIPFLFDTRDHIVSKEYLECSHCSSKFYCDFNTFDKGVNMTILQKAIRGDKTESPEFLG
ncbi:hypothetical protein EDC19_0881 [Natranaerovirga hydrolytica]|uniref:Uncharacterized protein n=1 Tax=Natranaerovirga hydrolytica TaxID=680378 RepID=A0A4R1N613_9FIRM|nr:hypothetical protein [Natranaerovirga hydrolytica]TCK98459.1 hypothetical protein EDC19_0881 [Natranaerovirga hydrolytica]